MSKAFTSEETPEQGPVFRPPPRVAPGEVRHVTPEGYAALRAELARLRADRADVGALSEPERIARAADLDRRIAWVDRTLAGLTVLAPDEAPEGVVAFGTWVTVEDDGGGVARWRIVGPDEAEPRRGLLSAHAPVARALLGRARGDSVEVNRPGGRTELTILDVSRTPPEGWR